MTLTSQGLFSAQNQGVLKLLGYLSFTAAG